MTSRQELAEAAEREEVWQGKPRPKHLSIEDNFRLAAHVMAYSLTGKGVRATTPKDLFLFTLEHPKKSYMRSRVRVFGQYWVQWDLRKGRTVCVPMADWLRKFASKEEALKWKNLE